MWLRRRIETLSVSGNMMGFQFLSRFAINSSYKKTILNFFIFRMESTNGLEPVRLETVPSVYSELTLFTMTGTGSVR